MKPLLSRVSPAAVHDVKLGIKTAIDDVECGLAPGGEEEEDGTIRFAPSGVSDIREECGGDELIGVSPPSAIREEAAASVLPAADVNVLTVRLRVLSIPALSGQAS